MYDDRTGVTVLISHTGAFKGENLEYCEKRFCHMKSPQVMSLKSASVGDTSLKRKKISGCGVEKK